MSHEQERLTGYLYPHKTDENSLELKLALFPGFAGGAYHYDFILEQHYAEAGVRYGPGVWWLIGRGGVVVWQEPGQSRPGGSPLPPEEKTAWDWEASAGWRLNDMLNVTAGFTGHEFEGEGIFVTFTGSFSLHED